MKLLECKKLNIGYNEKSVCKDISFDIESGEYLCIIGENGSGKSTMLKTLLGLNKPLGGKIITHDGFEKNNIGYLPQQSDFQKDFPATVREVIMSGFVSKMGYRPFYNKAEKEKAMQVADYLGITQLFKKSYRDLSGGQQQRVLLARALCASNGILVMDEPTNGLDARAIKKFYDLIDDLHDKGMTIIMVSHSIEKTTQYATHIVYLKDTCLFNGTKEEFLSSDIGKSWINKGESK